MATKKKKRAKRKTKAVPKSCSCDMTVADAKRILAKQARKKGYRGTDAEVIRKAGVSVPSGASVTMAKNGMCMVDVKQKGMKGGLKGRTTKRFLRKASC